MWEVLTEKPIHIGLFGAVLAAILFAIWLQIPKRGLFVAMLGVVLLTVGLVIMERMIVSDREAVVDTLYEIADSVEARDVNQLLPYIHSSATDIRNMAMAEYNRYRLQEARITHVWDVRVLPGTNPKQAEVQFNVFVSGATVGGINEAGRGVVFMKIRLQEEDGQWKVTHYEWNTRSAISGGERLEWR